MLNRLTFALLPLAVWAQTPATSTPGAPPDVDKALRERVSQFFSYHVAGDFRKAYDLVADDTRDEYFASKKIKLERFAITGITYNADFTDAEVETDVDQFWNIRGQSNLTTVPMRTTWKIEDGKWMWYHHIKTGAALTPMGPSTIPDRSASQSPNKIPEKIDDAALAGRTQGILNQLSLEKNRVKLAGDKPSSDKVLVHNGTQGYVQLSLATLPEIPGFSVKFDRTQVPPNQDAVLQFDYKPAKAEPREPFQVRIAADPFNQVLIVNVNLGDPPAAN
jgi:hypothetical protein